MCVCGSKVKKFRSSINLQHPFMWCFPNGHWISYHCIAYINWRMMACLSVPHITPAPCTSLETSPSPFNNWSKESDPPWFLARNFKPCRSHHQNLRATSQIWSRWKVGRPSWLAQPGSVATSLWVRISAGTNFYLWIKKFSRCAHRKAWPSRAWARVRGLFRGREKP